MRMSRNRRIHIYGSPLLPLRRRVTGTPTPNTLFRGTFMGLHLKQNMDSCSCFCTAQAVTDKTGRHTTLREHRLQQSASYAFDAVLSKTEYERENRYVLILRRLRKIASFGVEVTSCWQAAPEAATSYRKSSITNDDRRQRRLESATR